MMKKTCFVFIAASLLSVFVNADALPVVETDWFTGTEGEKGSIVGAEVLRVEPTKEPNKAQVEISFPVPEGKEVEEVVVVEKRPKGNIVPEVIYEVNVVKDYEAGRSGIVITLGKGVPFKLMFNYIEHQP